jgi:hypothetical protein
LIDMGNPLARTTAGRINLAENLLQAGFIKTPEQYMQVINTGQIEPMIEGQTAELMLIKSENESLNEGRNPGVVLTENHMLHIKEHKSVLSSPEAKEDANTVGATLAHIQMHVESLRTGDPNLLMLLGQQPLTPPGMPPGIMGEGTIPQGGEVPQNAETVARTPSLPGRQPNLPSMPKNALTGEEFNQETGGLM